MTWNHLGAGSYSRVFIVFAIMDKTACWLCCEDIENSHYVSCRGHATFFFGGGSAFKAQIFKV